MDDHARSSAALHGRTARVAALAVLLVVLGLSILRDKAAVVGHQEAGVVRDLVRSFQLHETSWVFW